MGAPTGGRRGRGAAPPLWWVVGAGTVDDGYIAGIVRSRGENGTVGNVYRWLNAPEAPFSWFDEPYFWWSAGIGPRAVDAAAVDVARAAVLGARVAAVAAPVGPGGPPRSGHGVARGARVRHLVGAVEPGTAARSPGSRSASCWWCSGSSARSRPGACCPLAAALAGAGATTAVQPGGLMPFAPVLAAAVPLLRLLRGRGDLQLAAHRTGGSYTRTGGLAGVRRALPLLAVLVAAPASALLLMAADQGAAALAEAVRVRGLIGGGLPLVPGVRAVLPAAGPPARVQGAIGRRAAVVSTILAAAGVAWTLRGAGPRRDRGGSRLGGCCDAGLSAVAMMVSPTKWTQHFGALAGLGTAALTLGLVVFGRRALAGCARPVDRARRHLAGLAGATVVCGLVLAGQNMWPFVSGWYTPTFSTMPPLVGTVPVATTCSSWAVPSSCAAGAVGVAAERGAPPRGAARPRSVPAAGRARRGRARRRARAAGAEPGADRGGPPDGYTPASTLLATLRRRPVRAAVGVAGRDRPRRRRPPGRPAAAAAPGVVPAPAVPPARPAASTRVGPPARRRRSRHRRDVLVHPRSPAA